MLGLFLNTSSFLIKSKLTFLFLTIFQKDIVFKNKLKKLLLLFCNFQSAQFSISYFSQENLNIY